MDKKLRKKLSEQIGVAIALLLKNTDPYVAIQMEKHIRSSAKDIAKKFLKTKKEIADKVSDKASKVRKAVAPLKGAGKKAVRKVVKKARVAKKALKG